MRGFSEITHALFGVAVVSQHLLGIGDDPIRLFDSNNSMEYINKAIAFYTKHGTNPPGAEIADFLEKNDNDHCSCADCTADRAAYRAALV
jgi:hypothetical protein